MPQPTETTDGALAAPAAPDAPFGSVFGPAMAVSRFDGTTWSVPEVVGLDSFALHPGTHALHYGSSCFEGLKAHRYPDGRVVTFRAEAHIARLRQSTARLCLPVPSASLVADLIAMTVDANEAVAPASPGRCTCARRCSART